MFKPMVRDFYETAVADHELAAIQCADPMMREVWLATAAEWRIVSLTRPAPRRPRKVKTADRRLKSPMGDVLVFAPAIATAAMAVAPEFRRRELNELLAGQLIMDMHAVGAEAEGVAVLHDVDALAAANSAVMPTLDVHDLIL